MALQSIIKSGGTKRLILLAGALLLAALAAIPASNVALAQTPPGAYVTLVNEGENFIERKGDGRFIARPIFDRELDVLYYGVRNPDTGQWLAGMYRVQGGREGAQRRLGVLLVTAGDLLRASLKTLLTAVRAGSAGMAI